jgi:hypothetical protein
MYLGTLKDRTMRPLRNNINGNGRKREENPTERPYHRSVGMFTYFCCYNDTFCHFVHGWPLPLAKPIAFKPNDYSI